MNIDEVNEEETETPRPRTIDLQNVPGTTRGLLGLTALINEDTKARDRKVDRARSREEFERRFPLNMVCKTESHILSLKDGDERDDVVITSSDVPDLVQKIRDPADVDILLPKLKDAIEREENVANSVLANTACTSNVQSSHDNESIKSTIRKSALELFASSLGDVGQVMTTIP